jgi:SHS family lactate transporter-like MFS transporter
MGGEWGVGASLTMETIPPQTRGVVSGILQTGYPSGYLLASITYFALYGTIGWRGMFMVGALPALLVLFIRAKVEESPAFLARTNVRQDSSFGRMLRDNAGRFAHDGFQFLQPWHARPLPDLPAAATSFRATDRRSHRDRL